MSAGPALIVGLGNPGAEYERTRHNVGFRVVDVIAARLDARLKPLKGIRAIGAEARDGETRVILAQPTTYMNVSGEAVRELIRYYKVAIEDVVIVHDEVDLPFGALRVKRGGGEAGHNGLRSITRALGTPEYARVRVGVGRPQGGKKTVDHVLGGFSKREEDELGVLLEESADATLAIVREGVEPVQGRLHADVPPPPPKPKARRIRKEVIVDAPRAHVWQAWTTSDGARTFFAPEANIELTEGGPYELYFHDGEAGARGSEGCTVLGFQNETRLTVSWNAPPEFGALRDERTKVDVALKSAGGGRTRVNLTHSGFGEGTHWDQIVEYFERAWDTVLGRLALRFADGPIDWSAR